MIKSRTRKIISLISFITCIVLLMFNNFWFALLGIIIFICGFAWESFRIFSKTSSSNVNIKEEAEILTIKPNQNLDRGLKHYYHPSLLWFVAGFEVFGLLMVYIGIQVFLLNIYHPTITTILDSPNLRGFLLPTVLFAIFGSIPLGFVLFQIYYVTYWKAFLPLRFSEIDRVYDALIHLEQENPNIIYSNFLVGCEGIENTTVELKSLLLSKRLGFDAFINPSNASELLTKAQNNWILFNNMYYSVLSHADSEKYDLISTRKEENYALMGVSRISILLAWIFFLPYGLIRFGNQPIPLLISLFLLLVTLLTILLFITFSITRKQLGANAIDFKYSLINIALDHQRKHIRLFAIPQKIKRIHG